MAIDDFGGKVNGQSIELLTADHQNKADIAALEGARMDRHAGPEHGVRRHQLWHRARHREGGDREEARALQQRRRVFRRSPTNSAAPTPCTTPTTPSRWPRARAPQWSSRGGKSWFFLTADYAFGAALEADTTTVIKEKGGTVVGGVKHPLNAFDFSSFLLQAQNSKAQILGLANAGGDTINSIKAARSSASTRR